MDYARQHVNEICEAMARRSKYDKAKYIQVAERLYKPSQLQKAKEHAEDLALRNKKSYAVVQLDKDHYHVWSLAGAGKNYVYVAEYVPEVVSNV